MNGTATLGRRPEWRPLAVLAAALLVPQHPEVAFAVGAVALSLLVARAGGEAGAWLESSWGFARQILPLLFAGVLVAGMLLGRPGGEELVPGAWVAAAVGGNSPGANVFAALAGALMYFATLTEVPIVQGLLANGMGQGPALAVDGEVRSSGRVPSVEEVEEILRSA